jgi:hypothetical protein
LGCRSSPESTCGREGFSPLQQYMAISVIISHYDH